MFNLILKDNTINYFYKNKNIQTVINKYTYFIANQIGATFNLIAPDIYKTHDDVM